MILDDLSPEQEIMISSLFSWIIVIPFCTIVSSHLYSLSIKLFLQVVNVLNDFLI